MSAPLIAKFKASKWATPADSEAFLIESQGFMDASFVIKLLEVLTSKNAAADSGLHRKRLEVFKVVVEKVREPSLFVPLLKTLRSCDPALRACLVAVLPKVNNIAEHAELANSLNNPDAGVRSAVVTLLTSIGGK